LILSFCRSEAQVSFIYITDSKNVREARDVFIPLKNPEFYQAKKMRLPTWNKPHILYCYEFFPKYIGLPVGCLEGLLTVLEHYKITPELQNKQNQR